jgi:Uma2 family endonuclease
MTNHVKLLTIDEFERMPEDGWRSELVRGRVVREPPAGFEHGWLASSIDFVLRRHAQAHRLGLVCGAETGFVLATYPPLVRAPDVAFVARSRIPREPVKGFFRGAPDLAVEVVSPSNTAADVQAKVLDYLQSGTRLVWVVYPETRTVAVHRSRSEARIVSEAGELEGYDVLPDLRIEVSKLFERD